MELSLEDRIATITIDGKNYTCEVRQYSERGELIVWVPEKGQSVSLQYANDASTSGRYTNDNGDSVTYQVKTWRKSGFTKIKAPRATSTN